MSARTCSSHRQWRAFRLQRGEFLANVLTELTSYQFCGFRFSEELADSGVIWAGFRSRDRASLKKIDFLHLPLGRFLFLDLFERVIQRVAPWSKPPHPPHRRPLLVLPPPRWPLKPEISWTRRNPWKCAPVTLLPPRVPPLLPLDPSLTVD